MMRRENGILLDAVELRNILNETRVDMKDLMKIYIGRPLSDYIKYDAILGGYIPHKRKLHKRNFFV